MPQSSGSGPHTLGALRLESDADYLLVHLDGGPRWVRDDVPASVSSSPLWAKFGSEMTRPAIIQFMADGDRAMVRSPEGVMAVQFSTGRVRMLDRRASRLEWCRLAEDRESMRCELDMMWDHAVFNADGEETRGTFEPVWR